VVVICPLISRQLTALGLSKGCNAPHLGRICQVSPYPLTRSQDMFIFLEDAGRLEGKGIMNAASMANGVVHDDK